MAALLTEHTLPKRTANCLVWLMVARKRLPGGYSVARMSRGGNYWHFLWLSRDRMLKPNISDPPSAARPCSHKISFVPAWANAYATPTPFWKVGFFTGQMRWGDQLKPRVRGVRLTGYKRRYALLQASVYLVLAVLAVLVVAAWWCFKIAWGVLDSVAWLIDLVHDDEDLSS